MNNTRPCLSYTSSFDGFSFLSAVNNRSYKWCHGVVWTVERS